MKKQNKFILTLIVAVSIALTILIVSVVIDTTGLINQGEFRVNDIAIFSTVKVEESGIENSESSEALKTLKDLKLNISQKNEFSILIEKNQGIKSLYIDNIKLTNPKLYGNVSLNQSDLNLDLNLSQKTLKQELTYEEQEGQILLKFNINNNNFLTDATLAEEKNSIIFDGTILKLLNVNIDNIQFDISFDISIVDDKNKTNTFTVNMKLPNEALINVGAAILKEDPANFPFKLK